MHRSVRRITVTVAAASLLAVGMAAPPATAAAAAPPSCSSASTSRAVSTNKARRALQPDRGSRRPHDVHAQRVLQRRHEHVGQRGADRTSRRVATFVFAGTLLAALRADQTTGAGLWNGNDAIVLAQGRRRRRLDRPDRLRPRHRVGNRPRLDRRQHAAARRVVCVGDTEPNNAFDPAAEWVGFAQNTFDGLGAHTADCGGDPEPVDPVINEFSAEHRRHRRRVRRTARDEPGADLSALPGARDRGRRRLDHRRRRRGDLVRTPRRRRTVARVPGRERARERDDLPAARAATSRERSATTSTRTTTASSTPVAGRRSSTPSPCSTARPVT